jgi:hypothetical protein
VHDVLMNNLPHVLCALLLIARIGDILSTYLVTPKLLLETNPIVRQLRWPYAILTSGLCIVPYFNEPIAVALIVGSLLVTASNARQIWFVRAFGEEAFAALRLELAKRTRMSHALAGTFASSVFIGLLGLTILLFYSDPADDWGFWIGFGALAEALVVGFYQSLSILRLFREARRQISDVGSHA